MTKFEAARLVSKSHAWFGEIHPGSEVTLDGTFSIEELEAFIVLLKVANEDDAEVDVTGLATSKAGESHD